MTQNKPVFVLKLVNGDVVLGTEGNGTSTESVRLKTPALVAFDDKNNIVLMPYGMFVSPKVVESGIPINRSAIIFMEEAEQNISEFYLSETGQKSKILMPNSGLILPS